MGLPGDRQTAAGDSDPAVCLGNDPDLGRSVLSFR
jgi:hypothetical protein